MNGLPTFMTASVYMLSYSLVFCSRRTVGLSLLPVLTGTDMPPAKVFHQKLRWLKVEGGGKFSAVGMPQPQVFLEQCSSRLFMWKITVITYFSLPILSSPPKKHDILGDRATVFYKLAYSPIEFSVLPLYYPPDMYGTFIYSTHTGRYMCTQAHRHQRTHTHTHRLAHHSNKNTYICKHRPQTEASSSNVSCCFLIRVLRAPWSNLTHSENLQCRLSSFRCLLGGQDAGCIIYDEANRQQVIGTKQTREQPLIPERCNQTRSLCI